jgi:hypothetical protein
MEDIVAKGWQELDKRAHPIDDKKTHYVRVLYHEGGQYEVQSRQEDGYTGMVTPLRKNRTTDRRWVARQAALMITQDFGMVGVVTETVKDVVRIKFKGAGLGQPDSIRVQAFDVLALTRLKSTRGITSTPVESALLYVTSVQGSESATTQLFSRFPVELNKKVERSQIGYRVVKLGTCWAPLQVRVVDRETKQPIAGVGISICPGGDEKQAKPIGATDPQGRVRSQEIYRNVAFVRLTQPGRNAINIPLPLLDDRFIDCFLAGNELVARRADFEYHLRAWARRVTEAHSYLNGEWASIRDLLRKDKEQEAVRKAKDLSTKLQEDMVALRGDLDTLIGTHAPPAGEGAVTEAKRQQTYIDELAARVEKILELIKDIEDPSPASRKIREARDFEEMGEAAKAIEAYDEALKSDPSRTKIKDYVAGLKKVWNIKAPDLDKARTFIFDTWPEMDPTELDTKEKDLDDAIKALEKHSDNLSALKLFKANVNHREKLNNARSSLNPDTNENDQESAQRIDKILGMLVKYNTRVLEVMERGAK